MKNYKLEDYILNYIEDEYAMNVLYYSIKDSLIKNDCSFRNVLALHIDGRFYGDAINLSWIHPLQTPIDSIAFTLSFRLVMLNHDYLELFEDSGTILMRHSDVDYQWIENTILVLSNWQDEEVRILFKMMKDCYIDNEVSADDKNKLNKLTVKPDYRGEKEYYQSIAGEKEFNSYHVIGNKAYLESEFERFVVKKNKRYVGNTAFAYCNNLHTIVFEDKVFFGIFPIIECPKLQQIVVPEHLLSYYKENLPYYKDLITTQEREITTADPEPTAVINETKTTDDDDLDIEIVEVGIPTADSYIEVDVQGEHKQPSTPSNKDVIDEGIDVKKIKEIYDKKATTYKYFWFMAIITLAKEKKQLMLSYQDILIRMVVLAWPIIFEYEIDFGKQDKLKDYLNEIVKKTSLIKTASNGVVNRYLKQHYTSQGIDKILTPLLKNVPYRFLSPWIKFVSNEDVIEKSNARNFNGPYALMPKDILLDEDWWEYIEEHFEGLSNFSLQSFISYIKQYNGGLKLIKLKTVGWDLSEVS